MMTEKKTPELTIGVDNIDETYGLIRIKRYDKRHDVFDVVCRCGKQFTIHGKQFRDHSVYACEDCRKLYFPTTRSCNIMGKQYGVLKVIKPNIEEDGQFHRKWICECVHCESRIVTSAGPLVNGEMFFCPICGAGIKKSDQYKKGFSLRARQFGSLTVRYQSSDKKRALPDNDDWECKCACGEQVTYTREELLSGVFTDCGCGCSKSVHWSY